MPCNRNKTFILPKCESGLYELWPCIITKAILKLYSYKYNTNNYVDLNDFSVIYSLTGYIPERLNKQKEMIKEIELTRNTSLKHNVDDSNNKNKRNMSPNHLRVNSNFTTFNNKSTYNENRNIDVVNELPESNRKNITPKTAFSSNQLPLNNRFNMDLKKEKLKQTFLDLTEEEKLEFFYICRNLLQENKYLSRQKLVFCYNLNTELDEEYTVTRKMRVNELSCMRLTSKLSGINAVRRSSKKLFNLGTTKEPVNKLPKLGDAFKKRLSMINQDPPLNSLEKLNNNDILNLNKLKKSEENTKDLNLFIPNKTGLKQLDRLLVNYPYALVDIFDNEPTIDYDFNMFRLTPLDFNKFKKNNTGNTKQIQYKQMTKDEKKNYIEVLEKLNNEFKAIKKERMDNLDKPGQVYYLFKLLTEFPNDNQIISENNSDNNPKTTLSEYNELDIKMAQVCKINKWRYPPLEYLESKFYNSTYSGVKLGLKKETDKNDLDNENINANDKEKNDNFKEKFNKEKEMEHNTSSKSIGRERREREKNRLNNRLKNKKINFTNIAEDVNEDKKYNDMSIKRVKDNISNYSIKLNTKNSSSKKFVNVEAKAKWEEYKKPKWTEYWFNLVQDLTIFHQQIDLIKRNTGSWLQLEELLEMFNRLVVLHNPDYYKSNLTINNIYTYYNNNPFEINTEMDCILLLGDKSTSLISKLSSFDSAYQDKIIYQAKYSNKISVINNINNVSVSGNSANNTKDNKKEKDIVKTLAAKQLKANKGIADGNDPSTKYKDSINEINDSLMQTKNSKGCNKLFKEILKSTLIKKIKKEVIEDKEKNNDEELNNLVFNNTKSTSNVKFKVNKQSQSPIKGNANNKRKDTKENNAIRETEEDNNKDEYADILPDIEKIKWSNCKLDLIHAYNNRSYGTNNDNNRRDSKIHSKQDSVIVRDTANYISDSKEEFSNVSQLNQLHSITPNPRYNFENIATNSSCALIHFEPNYRSPIDNCPIFYYIVLELVSLDKRKIKKDIILSSVNNTYQHDLLSQLNDYIILIRGGVFPFGFNLKIFSDHILYATSSFNLYKEIWNFPCYTFPVNSVISERGKFNLLFKAKINILEYLKHLNIKELLIKYYNKALYGEENIDKSNSSENDSQYNYKNKEKNEFNITDKEEIDITLRSNINSKNTEHLSTIKKYTKDKLLKNLNNISDNPLNIDNRKHKGNKFDFSSNFNEEVTNSDMNSPLKTNYSLSKQLKLNKNENKESLFTINNTKNARNFDTNENEEEKNYENKEIEYISIELNNEIQFKFSCDYKDNYVKQFLHTLLFEDTSESNNISGNKNILNKERKEAAFPDKTNVIDHFDYTKVYLNNLITHKPILKVNKDFFASDYWKQLYDNEINNNNNNHHDKSIKTNSNSNNKDTKDFNEYFFDNENNLYLINDLIIILGIETETNIETENFNFNVFTNSNNVSINKIETNEAFEISDKYAPNKNGIIFQELIYTGEKVYSTIELTLKQPINSNNNFDTKERLTSATSEKDKKKKVPQSAKSEYNFTFGEKMHYSKTESVKAFLEVYKENTLLAKFGFYNSLVIPNLSFIGNIVEVNDKKKKDAAKKIKDIKNKKDDKDNEANEKVKSPEEQNPPYNLKCYIDFSESDNQLKVSNTVKTLFILIIYLSYNM